MRPRMGLPGPEQLPQVTAVRGPEEQPLEAEYYDTEHQDSVITREVARDLGIAAHLAGENAFSYGLLCEQDACDAERLQAQACRIWKKVSRRLDWPG